jgi:hypothetical protein
MELEFGPPTRDMGASEIAFQWDKIAIDGDPNIRPWRPLSDAKTVDELPSADDPRPTARATSMLPCGQQQLGRDSLTWTRPGRQCNFV